MGVTLLSLFLWAAAVSAHPPVVAKIGSVVVTREMVACRQPGAPSCHDAEQLALDRIFTKAYLDVAAEHYGIVITDADLARSGRIPDDVTIARVAAHQREIIEAVKRVHDGADARTVYERDLRPAAVSEAEFAHYRAFLTSDARLQSALSQDLGAEYRDRIRKAVRERLVFERLQERVARDAAAHGQTIAQAEEAMSRELAALLHPVILDPSFSEPSLKGAITAGSPASPARPVSGRRSRSSPRRRPA
jgi:hypothetical protein